MLYSLIAYYRVTFLRFSLHEYSSSIFDLLDGPPIHENASFAPPPATNLDGIYDISRGRRGSSVLDFSLVINSSLDINEKKENRYRSGWRNDTGTDFVSFDELGGQTNDFQPRPRLSSFFRLCRTLEDIG